jgi:hypothetical protein
MPSSWARQVSGGIVVLAGAAARRVIEEDEARAPAKATA